MVLEECPGCSVLPPRRGTALLSLPPLGAAQPPAAWLPAIAGADKLYAPCAGREIRAEQENRSYKYATFLNAAAETYQNSSLPKQQLHCV